MYKNICSFVMSYMCPAGKPAELAGIFVPSLIV